MLTIKCKRVHRAETKRCWEEESWNSKCRTISFGWSPENSRISPIKTDSCNKRCWCCYPNWNILRASRAPIPRASAITTKRKKWMASQPSRISALSNQRNKRPNKPTPSINSKNNSWQIRPSIIWRYRLIRRTIKKALSGNSIWGS